MRKSHTKPVQLDLFGLPQDSNPIVTPKWQSLPIPVSPLFSTHCRSLNRLA